MLRISSLLFLALLWSCNSENQNKPERKISSLKIEIRPSFGERSKFIIDQEMVSAMIEVNRRFNYDSGQRPDTLYYFSKKQKLDFKNWQNALTEMPLDSIAFLGQCQVLDGWRIRGQISFEDSSQFNLDYQDCKSDSIAHSFTQSAFKELNRIFRDDPVVQGYLEDIYNRYYLGQKRSMDSTDYGKGPFAILRRESFEAFLKQNPL